MNKFIDNHILTVSEHDSHILVDGLMRRRTNSEGNPIDVTDPGIAEFWRWYEDGPTDEGGRPIVLHHGTSILFSAFENTKRGRFAGEAGSLYFTDDVNLARGYGSIVLDVYVRMSNPLIYDTGMRRGMSEHDFDPSIPSLLWADGRSEKCNWGDWWTTANPSALPFARQAKADGIILRGIKDNAAGVSDEYRDVYVAFDPNQVKSIRNTQTWDQTSSLLMSEDAKRLSLNACKQVAERFEIPTQAVFDIATHSPSDLISRWQDDLQATPNQMGAPKSFRRHALGSARVAEYGGPLNERYVDFLEKFNARDLTTMEAEQGIKSHPTYQTYLDWAKRGIEPPYISVYETDSGTLQSTNRRRTLVAQELGSTITGWLGKLNQETGQPLKYGDVVDAYRHELRSTCVSNSDNANMRITRPMRP